MQTNNKMAVAPVGKLIWQMSIPPLISMFLQYSYNLIDSAFVARLSENALIAVSLAFPITTLMNAASIWIGVGVNVLIAGYLGQKKQDDANTTVTHGLLLAFGIGALLNLLALLIMKPYFRAFTNNEEIYQLSIAYMSVCSFMQIPNMVHTENSTIRAAHSYPLSRAICAAANHASCVLFNKFPDARV